MIRCLVTCALTASIGASALAQTSPQSPVPQTPVPAPQPGAMVTVEGCLTQEMGPNASTAAFTYVLTDRSSPATGTSAPSASRTSGATASGLPSTTKKMYVLRGQTEAVALAKHVNHIVRVTGATTAPMTTSPLAGRSPEATPNPAATAPPGSTGTVFDTANLPTLTVTTLSMVAQSCR